MEDDAVFERRVRTRHYTGKTPQEAECERALRPIEGRELLVIVGDDRYRIVDERAITFVSPVKFVRA